MEPEASSAQWALLGPALGLTYRTVALQAPKGRGDQPSITADVARRVVGIVMQSLDSGRGAGPALVPGPGARDLGWGQGGGDRRDQMLGCEGLKRLLDTKNKTGRRGWWKSSYVVPEGVVKMPRLNTGGHWAHVWAELHSLRNVTLPHLRPFIAAVRGLCLDPVRRKYLLLQENLPSGYSVPALTLPQFASALRTFLALWDANSIAINTSTPLFFFYGDAPQKNWRFTASGVLRMFDFDASRWVLVNTACGESGQCTSGINSVQACVANRCAREGMANAVTYHIQMWCLPPTLSSFGV